MIHKYDKGEHLAAIAAKYGFLLHKSVWNAGENADLRAAREDPFQLVPNDEVAIPEKQAKSMARPTHQAHWFTARTEILKLRLRVLDLFGEPFRNSPGVLKIGGTETAVTSDGDGCFEATIPRTTMSATLAVGEVVFHLDVGALEPASEPTGMRARLGNMGCWAGDIDDTDPIEEYQTEGAIELYQDDHELPVTGEASDALGQQLEEDHGC